MDEPEGRSRYLDLALSGQVGAQVLADGLPALPGGLTYEMTSPVAYWAAAGCGVVLFLHFRQWDDHVSPIAMVGTFLREDGRWRVSGRAWTGGGWSHDPIAQPGYVRDLDGRAIVGGWSGSNRQAEPGQMAAVMAGRVAPEVKQIALIQDGQEDRRALESHFGAWVVCTEQPTPSVVTALDENGSVLGSISW